MKKIILSLMFAILSLININANEINIVNNPYKQTQILKTVFPGLVNIHSNWIKQDSVNIIFDFIKNNKITVKEENSYSVYKITKIRNIKNDVGIYYKMKGIDSKNIKYDIIVLYYNDNNVVFILANDSNVVRYKTVN
jgi:hypothetical protein